MRLIASNAFFSFCLVYWPPAKLARRRTPRISLKPKIKFKRGILGVLRIFAPWVVLSHTLNPNHS